MTELPGMSRKFWRETPKQLLLFVKRNVSLHRNELKVQQPSAWIPVNRRSASMNLTEQPSRLSLSRESLADDLDHPAGAYHPGLDCLSAGDIPDGMVDLPTIFQEFVAC